MRRLSCMLVAGEPSGDTLAAELVVALREEFGLYQSRPSADFQPLFASLEPRFFGAGGPCMAAAGVELAVDMTAHTAFGLTDVLRRIGQFWKLRERLKDLALTRLPDVIICVDFSGFNRRLVRAIKNHVRTRQSIFQGWNPRIVQYVSPQVWASRPGRVRQMAEDLDLLLSIFPFESAWYAERAPGLRVEYVGHPMLDRYAGLAHHASPDARRTAPGSGPPVIALLPGSRTRELRHHLPVMLKAAALIHTRFPASWKMVLPGDHLAEAARGLLPAQPPIECQVGGLAEVLGQAELAIASSGTVTMECACFGVPTVVLYKVSRPEFEVARFIVRVSHIAMPNLLAGETVFPEFVQQAATPENLSQSALDLLNDPSRRQMVRERLSQIIAGLGGPGAARRAAAAIVQLLG